MKLIDALAQALQPDGKESSDFDLNPGVALPAERKLRPAGVLVACVGDLERPKLLLTKRSSRLKHHPGQIAFPGGKVDPTDDGPVAAALREAEEEVGLPQAAVDILGPLATHETVTGFSIVPVLGLVREAFDPVPEAGEVDEVFTVPLEHVLRCENYIVQSRLWRGQRRFYYTVPYGPYYIWGATARILRGLAERVTL